MDSSSSDTPQSADENMLETPPPTVPEIQEPAEPLHEHDQADNDVSSKFHDGQMLRFVRVRFPGNNKPMPFFIGDLDYHYGQKVVAMSEKGMAVGFVNSFAYEVKFHRSLLPIRSIVKFASAEDGLADEETFREERRLREIVDRMIEKSQLDMVVTQVELTQLGKKAIFSFTAPTRVDFRGLVHEIVGVLKMRIELRQISVRDRAAAVGGLGPCGRELCCSSFLAKYGNVGIKLAKNQDLSLNSSKINGVCGQLKCCLTYEDEVYQEKRKKMPRDNALVKTKDGNQGKVIRLHILTEQFETISPEGIIRRYVAEMWDGLAEGLEIPKFFENGVTDLSKTVIGMDQVAARKAEEHERHVKEAKLEAKNYADKIFEQLFGEKTLDWSLPDIAEPNSPLRKLVVPEEEEEIVYVAPEDESLDDDDDEEDMDGEESHASADDDDDMPAAPAQRAQPTSPPLRQEHRPDYHANPRQQDNRPRQDDRPRQQQPQRHDQRPRDDRPRDDRPRQQDNRGPRPDQNRGPHRDPQQTQGPRPQQPPREPGQPGQAGEGQRRRRRGGRGGRGGGNGGPQRPPQG
jgi:cell fate regulator YaaT (PSP1 superfamily)